MRGDVVPKRDRQKARTSTKRRQGGGGADGYPATSSNGLTLGTHFTNGQESEFFERRVTVET